VLRDELRDSMHFRGLTITDALTMAGVAKMFTQEQIAIRSIEAGAEILLKPADVRPVIDAVTARAERDAGFAVMVRAAAKKNLEMKARVGLHRSTQMSLDSLRAVVGQSAHREVASTIALRAVTVLRDSTKQIPLARNRSLQLVIYAPETEVGGGSAFAEELRRYVPTTVTRVGPQTPRTTLDSIATRAAAGRLVILTVVRRVEGRGRTALVPTFAEWVNDLAIRLQPVVVAAGNPYVLAQFPRVSSYMTTFSVGEAPERAAARVLVSPMLATGRSPVGLPGVFGRGDGIRNGGTP
jgi:beta-N-acetylhexosaminidase